MCSIGKARKYAGLLVVLEASNMTSLALSISFIECIAKGCGITEKEVLEQVDYAKRNVDFESSCVHVCWK